MAYMKKVQAQASIPQKINSAFLQQAVLHATRREKWVVVAGAYLMFMDATPERPVKRKQDR